MITFVYVWVHPPIKVNMWEFLAPVISIDISNMNYFIISIVLNPLAQIIIIILITWSYSCRRYRGIWPCRGSPGTSSFQIGNLVIVLYDVATFPCGITHLDDLYRRRCSASCYWIERISAFNGVFVRGILRLVLFVLASSPL